MSIQIYTLKSTLIQAHIGEFQSKPKYNCVGNLRYWLSGDDCH